MTKKKKTALDLSTATPELVAKARRVVKDAKEHRYSVSGVYGAYNAAFGLKDTPQSCASCLALRAKKLKAWLEAYDGVTPTEDVDALDTSIAAEFDSVKAYSEFMGDRDTANAMPPAEQIAKINAFLETHGAQLTDAERDSLNGLIAAIENEPIDPQDGYPLAEGVIRFPTGDDTMPLDFTPNDPNEEMKDGRKGTILNADGTKVKAGTYETPSGFSIAVQVNGKATIKANADDLM